MIVLSAPLAFSVRRAPCERQTPSELHRISTTMLLRAEQLTKDYGRFRALDHLDLQVEPGEIVGMLGPNGSGKTTALRLMLGFLRPTLGRAVIAGHDCWRDSVAARRQVAYLPGELRLYENMTGRQLIRFLSDLRGQAVNGEVEVLGRL